MRLLDFDRRSKSFHQCIVIHFDPTFFVQPNKCCANAWQFPNNDYEGRTEKNVG